MIYVRKQTHTQNRAQFYKYTDNGPVKVGLLLDIYICLDKCSQYLHI